jgi:hypothetical protein
MPKMSTIIVDRADLTHGLVYCVVAIFSSSMLYVLHILLAVYAKV